MKHGESAYTVYATSESLGCFECGEIGHKRMACPRREKDATVTEDSNTAGQSSDGAQKSQGPVVGGGQVRRQSAVGGQV